MDVHLLPGLGADRRLFDRIELKGHLRHAHNWPDMPKGSSLRDYAVEIAKQIDASVPHALIGVSMGGMVAQELGSLTGAQRTIIVSSWKGPQEMPPSLRLLRGTHPERMLSRTVLHRMLPFVRWQMGIEHPQDVTLFNELVAFHSVEQLKVQVNACLMWEGPPRLPKHMLHIHGDQDRLMPIAHIKDPIVIRGGGHFMVVTKAEAVQQAFDLS